MELIRFSDATRAVAAFGSEGLHLSPLTQLRGDAAVLLAELSPGGRIARHPAAVAQLLAVVSGSGLVSGEDGREIEVGPGEAVRRGAGELHETRTRDGLVAVIVEGADLEAVAPSA